MVNATNGGLNSRRWPRRRASADDAPFDVDERKGGELVERLEVVSRAQHLGFPKCRYGLVELEGEFAWTAAAMPYQCDRRELLEQLDAIERGRR